MRTGVRAACALALLWAIGLTVWCAPELTECGPIVIKGDYQFTVDNGVRSGSGTATDPYVIEGWRIDAGCGDHGIRIEKTTRFVEIRNVEVSGAAKSGIFLSYARNVTIKACKLSANWVGIVLNFSRFNRLDACTVTTNTDGVHFYFSHDNQVLNCTFARNDTALWLDASNGNEVIGNTFSESYMGVFLDLGSTKNLLCRNVFVENVYNAHCTGENTWDYKGIGNYWFDYRGIDANGDRIGDTPYAICSSGTQDNFPLFTRP